MLSIATYILLLSTGLELLRKLLRILLLYYTITIEEILLYLLSRLCDVLPPLRSWVRALYFASDRKWEEFVKTLPSVVAFFRVLQFPPEGNVDRVYIRIIVRKNYKENCIVSLWG